MEAIIKQKLLAVIFSRKSYEGFFMSRYLILIALTMLPACLSTSSLQTARTVLPGKWTLTSAVGMQQAAFTKNEANESLNLLTQQENLSKPMLEVGGRLGLTKGIDVGLKLSTYSMASADIKYVLAQSARFAISTGLGASLGVSHIDKTHYKASDLIFPLYLSFDISDVFTIFLSPRAIVRSIEIKHQDSTSKDTLNLAGNVFGFQLGSYLMEFSFYSSTGQNKSYINQMMIGYVYGRDKIDREE